MIHDWSWIMSPGADTLTLLTIAKLMCIAFFFCLCPGEYTGTTTDDQAFSLDNIGLFVGSCHLSLKDSSNVSILASAQVHLTFNKQKNKEEDTVLAHAHSNHLSGCLIVSTIQQVMMHCETFWRSNRPYNGTVKLALYYTSEGKCIPLRATQFTDMIQAHTGILQPVNRINPKGVKCLFFTRWGCNGTSL